MTFATPLLAAYAAAVAIPALFILYFLKLRRHDVEVSSTLLWKKAIEDLQANAPFQRLRKNLLLLLQLLVLAAALFALAQPEFKGDGTVGSRHVILIDRSASMLSTDGDQEGSARIEIAKQRALEIIESLPEPGLFDTDDDGETAMVIAFDSQAEVVQNFTSNKSVLRRAVESVRAAKTPSSLKQAFRLSSAHTGTQKFEDQVQEKGFVPTAAPATIHIFSDGRLPDTEEVDATVQDSIRYHPIGEESAQNLSIVALDATRSFDDPGELKIFVGLENTAPERRTVDVELAIDGIIQATTDTVVAGASAEGRTVGSGDDVAAARPRPGLGGLVFPLNQLEGGVVTVRISTPEQLGNVLAVDDTAYLVVPPAKRLSVLLATSGNLFLQAALEGMNLSRDPLQVTPAQFQAMLGGTTIAGSTLADFDVVLLDGFLPRTEEGTEEVLPPGRFIAFGVVPPEPIATGSEAARNAVVLDWERDHPVVKHASMQNLFISKLAKLEIPDDSPAEVLAESDAGPIILEISDARTRALLMPFNVIDSNWPFDQGFVAFIQSAVQYLADDGTAGIGEMVRPGDTLTERLPLDARSVRLSFPSRDRDRVRLEPATDGTVSYEPIDETGIYTISWTGSATGSDSIVDDRPRRSIAANLLDTFESDIGTSPSISLPFAEVAGEAEQTRLTSQKLWPWLLMLALVIVCFEWWVYNRKVYL